MSKRTFAAAARTGSALLVRVKGNQPHLLETIEALCLRQSLVDRHETVDSARHGRQEHRCVEVFEVGGQLGADWRPGIACAARITRLTWCKNTRSGLWRAREEVAYYVCQIHLDANGFGRAVRAHWGIENRDHLVRDRILREDDSRIRKKPGIVARLRSFALNLLREDDSSIRQKPGIFARLRSFALNLLRANGISNISEAIYANALSLDRLLAYGLPGSSLTRRDVGWP